MEKRRKKQEHPSTYVVQDRSNEEELLRLNQQDRLFTKCMGGVLSEQTDPSSLQRVLDVGCGPGWWLVTTAKKYPSISELIGVDVSERIIEYAQAQTKQGGVSDRVQFQVGDVLRGLSFPAEYFDLVNQRFGMSWVRKWDWAELLPQYQRVCKPGGVIRITESSTARTNSPALARLMELSMQAFYQAGHFFTADPHGMIDHLAGLMQKHGIDQVQTKIYNIEFHKIPQARKAIEEDYRHALRTMAPFLRKWVKFSDDYDELYQQMLQEMQHPDFEVTQTILTAWGKKV